MTKAFSEHSTFIHHIPVEEKKNKLHSLKWHFYTRIRKKIYHTNRAPFVAKNFAPQIEHELMRVKSDAVLSLFLPQVAHLKSKVPVVIWTDATFRNLINFYPEFTNLCQETIEQGYLLDQKAMDAASLVIFCSDWAAKTAVDFYGIDPAKVKVVPYGANLENNTRSIKDIQQIVDAKSFTTCNLLLLGIDWDRKGGDTAFKVAQELNRVGLPTQLTIVGCQPPAHVSASFVRSRGFIDKSTPAGAQELNQLFTESHFLILPSRAECFGNVFCEASSFGLPSLATNVGGIPTAIKNDVNGKTFALDAEISEYSEYILQLFKNPQKYKELAMSSFDRYTTELNWKVNTEVVRDLICKIL